MIKIVGLSPHKLHLVLQWVVQNLRDMFVPQTSKQAYIRNTLLE